MNNEEIKVQNDANELPAQMKAEYELAQQQLNVCKDGINMVNHAMDVYQESKRIEMDIAKVQTQTTVQLANIAAKYSLCHDALIATFGERSNALQKHYDVLDKAMATGDRELAIVSLKGISSIVVENPLDHFEEMIKAWDDTSKPLELDF